MPRDGVSNRGDIRVAVARNELHVSVRRVPLNAHLQSLPFLGVRFTKNVPVKGILETQRVNWRTWNDPTGIANSTVAGSSIELDIDPPLELVLHCTGELRSIVGHEPMLLLRPGADVIAEQAVGLDASRFVLRNTHIRNSMRNTSRLPKLLLHKSRKVTRNGTPYSGIFPCFFGGLLSRFVSSMASAWISFLRVSRGWITASTKPRSETTYGLAKRSRNSSIFCCRTCSRLAAASSSRLYTMSTAPSGPITAISAVGHA